MTDEYLSESPFRRSAGLYQESDTLDMMRHGEDSDDPERKRGHLRPAALVRPSGL